MPHISVDIFALREKVVESKIVAIVEGLAIEFLGYSPDRTRIGITYAKSGDSWYVGHDLVEWRDHPTFKVEAQIAPGMASEVQVATFHSTATARTLGGEERAAWWVRITREQPVQIEYQQRTRREIPLVILDMPVVPPV